MNFLFWGEAQNSNKIQQVTSLLQYLGEATKNVVFGPVFTFVFLKQKYAKKKFLFFFQCEKNNEASYVYARHVKMTSKKM